MRVPSTPKFRENYNIQKLVTEFFEGYLKYFSEKDLEELKIDEHPELWNNLILPNPHYSLITISTPLI